MTITRKGKKMETNWTLIEEGPKLYVLTWFGTALVSKAFDDWIEHRHLTWGDTASKLLFVTYQSKDSVWESGLWKRTTRPRLLPTFEIDVAGSHRHSLKCIRANPPEAEVGSYVCALPTGQIEINREDVNDWETFILLDETSINLLTVLLCRGKIVQQEGVRSIEIEDGFMLRSGNYTFELHTTLEILRTSSVSSTTLEDTSGSGRQLIYDETQTSKVVNRLNVVDKNVFP